MALVTTSRLSEQASAAQIREIISLLFKTAPGNLEDGHLEVKGWCKDTKELFEKMSESCSCLANGDGGIVILGISEDSLAEKRFSNCPHKHVDAELLALKLSELTHPPVICDVLDATSLVREVTGFSDARAFAITVPKSSSINGHMTTKGVSKIRVGKECKPNFTAQDDFTKKAIPGLTLNHLSPISIAWAIASHERFYRTARNWSSNGEFLEQAGLIMLHPHSDPDEPTYVITLAALLLFGNEESLRRYVGHCETVLKTPAGTRTIGKNIVDSFRTLCENRSGLLPSLCRDVTLETMKELVMNAYIHRCYRVASGVVITANSAEFTIQSPGELASILDASDLIYCVPVYRNLLLAEGARFIGLCDKVGQGIDMIYRAVLTEGFDFPHFESGGGSFLASIPLTGSAEFREFVRKRTQSLSNLDEISVLRTLFARSRSTFEELASAMQRRAAAAKRVLNEMVNKQMIEENSGGYSLAIVVRHDIEQIFSSAQMSLGIDVHGDLVI